MGKGVAFIALVGAVVLVPAGTSAASLKPDLVVSSLSNPPVKVDQNRTFTVVSKVKNRGKARSGASTTGFYLSVDRAKSGADIRMQPGRRVGRLNPGKSASGSALPKVPLSTPTGSYFVIACADDTRKVRESKESNNCRVSGGAVKVESAPSSQYLIEQARQKGEITDEQAILYTVYADFGDPRLPSQYNGDGKGPAEIDGLDKAAENWDSLSQGTRDALDPYFLPPFQAGSWYEAAPPSAKSAIRSSAAPVAAPSPPGLATCTNAGDKTGDGWKSVSAVGGKVQVWWDDAGHPGDAAQAAAIQSALDSTIWAKVAQPSGLFREPLPDGGGDYANCRGGTNAVDIAVGTKTDFGFESVNWNGFATRFSNTSNCTAVTPGYLVIKRGLAGTELLATVVHEVTHLAQFAYTEQSCDDARWLGEATAAWMEDYAYPANNTEHGYANWYLGRVELPLEHYDLPSNDKDQKLHQYGAYLLPFFLARKYSKPELMTDIWNGVESSASLTAIDNALSGQGGFHDVWPKFVVDNWNRVPATDYKNWDNLVAFPNLVDGFNFAAPPRSAPATVALPTNIGHLSARYYRFTFDSNVKQIEFKNKLKGVAGANVQALVHIAGAGGGAWEVHPDGSGGTTPADDWTEKDRVSFCRANEDENVDELIVILSNSNKSASSTLTEQPDLKTDTKCTTHGTFAGTVTYTNCTPGPCPTGHGNFTGYADFEKVAESGGQGFWNVTGGSVTVGSAHFESDPSPNEHCVVDVPAKTFDLPPPTPQPGAPPPSDGVTYILFTTDKSNVAAPKYRFQLQAYATGGTQTCTNSSTGNTTTSGANFGFAVDTGTQAGDPQTEKVTGANATDQSSPPLNSNWSWTFEP